MWLQRFSGVVSGLAVVPWSGNGPAIGAAHLRRDVTKLGSLRTTLLGCGCLCLVLLGTARPATADLIGTQVTGSLEFGGGSPNVFDPANGFVPSGVLNTAGTTVTIATPPVEFGALFPGGVDIIGDFTGTTLTLSETWFGGFFANSQTFTFTDAAFTSLTEVTDNFPNGGVTGSLSGTTITITWPGGPVTAGTFAAVFTVGSAASSTAAPVPEPSSLLLACVAGCGSLLPALRRRFRRRAAGPSPAETTRGSS